MLIDFIFLAIALTIIILVQTLKKDNKIIKTSCDVEITDNSIGSSNPTNHTVNSTKCVRFKGTITQNALAVGSIPEQIWTSTDVTLGNPAPSGTYLPLKNGNMIMAAYGPFDFTFHFDTPITTFKYLVD